MNLRTLWKPAYVFRPQQIATRLAESAKGATGDGELCTPWGAALVVSRADAVGKGLLRSAVHEMVVTELLWRLTGPDDLAVDVGANVGYFTSLFAARARNVIAFEPHPAHVVRLQRATALWPSSRSEKLEMRPVAVSDRTGEAVLAIPENFEENEGCASLSPDTEAADEITVRTVTLDEVLGGRHVGVLKLDVEGHEPAVLKGAEQTLVKGRIRDLLFEDHNPLPTDVSRRLSNCGYTIFGLEEQFLGVGLVTPDQAPAPSWDAPNYLATLDPDRAQRLMTQRGWRSLRP